MRYRLLGHSGLRVSELCLGTMTFGEDLGWGAPKDESRRMYDAFREAGGNFIDTANIYTNGTSETFLGDFIGAEREQVVLATKYSFATNPPTPPNAHRPVDVNNAGNQRKNMLQSVEASLKRLKTDYLDLYWMHGWDALTPVEEVMRAFDDLVRQGKVLYIGISDTPAWIVSQANTLAELSGWTPFIALQIQYNLIERTPERELLPMARAFDLGVAVWSPLGAGVLTGKYNQSGAASGRTSSRAEPTRRDVTSFVRVDDQTLAIAAAVQQVAQEMRRTPAQVALNWIRQRGDNLIPILGARRLSQLQDNMACLEFRLSDAQIQRLNEVSKIDLGFPHEILASDLWRQSLFAGTYDLIDQRRS
jgi:aryl-alcohol dehydrogenase-like predicted oxidoreductase